MLQERRSYLGRFPALSDAVKASETAKEQLREEFVATYREDHGEGKKKSGLE